MMTLAVMLLTMAVSGAWADNTVKYALSIGNRFTSGQTVEVKDVNDVVATITYGETGGNDFMDAKATDGYSSLEGYTAYTEGNGKNGDKTGGTFYTIVPKYDGTITVAVVLNSGKKFYVLEDGTALTNYNGITVDEKYYGTYSFAVTKDKSYKFYCAGGKLGFYGFEFTYGGSSDPQPGKYTVTMAAEAGEGWTIAPAEATTTGVDKDTKITATYSGTKHVKSVTAVTKAAAPAVTYDKTVSINDGAVMVTAGEHWLITGTGTATGSKITISDGATVTLDGVNISGSSYCIKCAGSATIILKDGTTNTLTSTSEDYPALSIGDAGTTLTIQGSTGALNVTSGLYCAGIGGGYMNTSNTCGNIRIEGGVIDAKGGSAGAGIGSDCGTATCGNIDITGGTIVATGGSDAAGIGGGSGRVGDTSCGNITIKKTVTSVTATKGSESPNSIGAGYGSYASCGTVTIEEGANVTQN
ncbi:MAG: hypothetical protein IK058_03470 [Bacteroidales bacterium]|nr:hypothetical protein [Bacteroidales bacterium]